MKPHLPKLIRVEGPALVCASCRRRWRIPADGYINERNLEYLQEHALDHRPARRSLPRNPKRATTSGWAHDQAWRSSQLDPVECQTCYTWFTARRCPRCFPNYQMRRELPSSAHLSPVRR